MTGSSARLLSAEIATGLRGRSLDREVFPFSFEEFLRAEGLSCDVPHPGAKARLWLHKKAQDYLRQGGFPEVRLHEAVRRREILQSYVDAVVLRDVAERHRVANIAALRALVQRVMRNPTAKLSVNKFYLDLRSRGLRVSKDDLYAFLQHLSDAYLVFPVPLWSRSEKKRQVNPKKIYVIDNGIADAWSTGQTPDHGALLENAVFLSLRRRGLDVGYYETQRGREVDFAFQDGNQTVLLQVAWSIQDADTKARELRALAEAAQEVPSPLRLLVTLDEEGTEADGAVRVIPLWKFLLRGWPESPATKD